MAIKNFRVTDKNFQRNGISGRSFWAVRFSHEDELGFHPNMMAVIPTQANEKVRGVGVECFVLDLNDPFSAWRGDDFFRFVKEVIGE